MPEMFRYIDIVRTDYPLLTDKEFSDLQHDKYDAFLSQIPLFYNTIEYQTMTEAELLEFKLQDDYLRQRFVETAYPKV